MPNTPMNRIDFRFYRPDRHDGRIDLHIRSWRFPMRRISSTLAVTAFLLVVSGCGGMRGVEKRDVSTEIVYSTLPTAKLAPPQGIPQKAVYSANLTKDSLEKSGHVFLGNLDMRYLARGCFGSDCREYRGKVDATERLLKKAAERGGTLVLLAADNKTLRSGIGKDGDKCVKSHQEGAMTHHEGISRYVPGGRVVTYDYCTKWEWIGGDGDWIQSSGDVWRHDPELVRKIREAEKNLGLRIRKDNLADAPDTSSRRTEQCVFVDPVLGTPMTGWFDKCLPFDPRGGPGIGTGYGFGIKNDYFEEKVNGKIVYSQYAVWHTVDRKGKVTFYKKEAMKK